MDECGFSDSYLVSFLKGRVSLAAVMILSFAWRACMELRGHMARGMMLWKHGSGASAWLTSPCLALSRR